MKARRSIIPTALLFSLMAGGCTGANGRYPSLAIRDAERVTGTAQPVEGETAPVPDTPSADLAGRLEQLTADARRAHAAFSAAAPGARQAVNAAGGASVASDSWVAAQMAVAGLEASRSRLLIALAQLDSLHVNAQLYGGGKDAIASARDAVDAMAREEDDTLATLLARLPD